MKIRLKHCQVITPKNPPLPGAHTFEVPLLSSLMHHVKLARHRRERLINWPQTFARKGHAYREYQFRTKLADCFIFERKENADAALPKTLTFRHEIPEPLELENSRAELQGEVLTYVTDTLAVKVGVIASCRIDFYPTMADEFSARTDPVVADEERLNALYTQCFGREEKKRFRDVVLDDWSKRRSVLHVEYQTAQNN